MYRSVRSNVLRSLFGLALLVFLGLLPLQAQVDTGSITGTVSDSSGAVLSGAKVTLTNEGTGATLSVTTGSDGSYTFSPVRIGSYKIDASAQGFKTVTQTHVVVNVSANVLANLKLPPGSVSETVEVTGAVPVLQTQDASVGQVMDSRNVSELPLNGRNFTFLAQLSAGVNSPQADTRGNASTGAFSANGFRPAQNNYMLDGIDNNSDTVDFLNGTNFVVLPPVDAIQEFKVQTTDFSAEFGRSGAAVMNATVKSGTNELHGDVWEFFRNDKLDAADYFERTQDANGNWHTQKGELRQNQFGFTLGGPVVIPHVFNGRNKVFFFGDYEGLRRRQGTVQSGSVPTVAERTSNYTNLQDLITGQSGTHSDILGRTMPIGTVLDPATTRVSGTGFVRDPFTTVCANEPAGFTYTLAACPDLNMLPAGRLDPNAIKLLNLYPNPTSNALTSNYTNSPILRENRQAFDARLDVNFTQRDQTFFRFSYVDDPQFIPSIFGGVADGGGFYQGNQTALAQQSALVWNHVISPTTVNNARAGLNYLHTTRNIPEAANLSDLPSQYGILGIPQQRENGGLPAFGINGLQTLGGNSFLPSDEVSSTIQLNDDFTKIYGKHTFKMGIEWQHVKFSTLQPPWSRGQFNFDGTYTDIPNVGGGNTGRAQFLLGPCAAGVGACAGVTTPGAIPYVGGPNNEYASNISLSDNGKNYYGTYFQDDWKVSSKLTLNLGVRWDWFGLVYDHYAKQANFVPSGPPSGSPLYIIPPGPLATQLSSSFQRMLAADGISLAITNQYGKGLGRSQTTNWAPRFGFAYQATPKFVVRGGAGMFYNGFENRGYSPNLGENYPFQFSFQFQQKNDATPINQFGGCATATPTGGPTLETGFSCIPLDPLAVNALGLQLRGIQFDYQTPYSIGTNLTLQYELTPSLSVQAGYVGTFGRHLEVFPNSNLPTRLLPPNTTLTNGANPLDPTGPGTGGLSALQGGLPFPDFAQNASYALTEGSSYYHGLQTSANKKFANGLDFLFSYTYSKVRSDAYDLLNGFANGGGYRAPYVPGVGIHADYGLANFDIRNVIHVSGAYELPFGKGKKFMGNAGGVTNAVLGGWAVVWATTLQGGQPFQLACPTGTAAGTNCLSFTLAGSRPRTSFQKTPDGNVKMLNAAAFAQPCEVGTTATPPGCIPLPGVLALGGTEPTQIEGPGYHRLDFSLFKNFQLTERTRLEFRSEFFNILNHPNFNYPGFGGNGVVAVSGSTNFNDSTFGEIGSTRDAPYDSREIQFALKLYF
jgi:Carboxypeptidase regulatory-like domain/TonB dependent receptor